MGLSIWNLFKAGLLLTNASLILHRKRFLSKYGLDTAVEENNFMTEGNLKVQVRGFLMAIEYLRVPIIALNSLTIVFELLLGGT